MRILLLAPELLGESLALQLTTGRPDLEVSLRPEQVQGAPQLVIWSVDSLLSVRALQREVLQLQERWLPAPLLLLLPESLVVERDQLLALSAEGLLQNGDGAQLLEAIETLLKGGRVVKLQAPTGYSAPRPTPTMGMGQWLLASGLQQISNDLQVIEAMLQPPPEPGLFRLLLRGTPPGASDGPQPSALVVRPFADGLGGCCSSPYTDAFPRWWPE